MNWNRVLEFLMLFVILACMVTTVALVVTAVSTPPGQRWQVPYREEGARAFRAGVPANANPYAGPGSLTSPVWLDGWMAAAEEVKGTKK